MKREKNAHFFIIIPYLFGTLTRVAQSFLISYSSAYENISDFSFLILLKVFFFAKNDLVLDFFNKFDFEDDLAVIMVTLKMIRQFLRINLKRIWQFLRQSKAGTALGKH